MDQPDRLDPPTDRIPRVPRHVTYAPHAPVTPPPAPTVERKDPGFAAVALSVAIFGALIWLGVGGPAGVVFSLISMALSGIALRRIDKGTGGGRGLAVAGFLIGLSGILLPLLAGFLGL